MMNYELFKVVVVEKFMEFMPEEYQGRKLNIESVEKINMTLDGINLVGEWNVIETPTIYINTSFRKRSSYLALFVAKLGM